MSSNLRARSSLALRFLTFVACAASIASFAACSSAMTADTTPATRTPETRFVTATAKPTAYPIYSSYFTGKTPFHDTVAQLMKAGAKVVPNSAAMVSNFASQGLNYVVPYSQAAGMSPVYVVHSGDPSYTFECPEYGGCAYAGKAVHYPAGAEASYGSDHHLTSFDPVYLKGEVDGWGGYEPDPPASATRATYPGCVLTTSPAQPTSSCPHPCDLSSSRADCSTGGFAAFSSSGLGNGATAAGYTYGLFAISAQELENGHIDHALGLVASCLAGGQNDTTTPTSVYPSIPRYSDTPCPGTSPEPIYGYMAHLQSNVNIASFDYSPYCAVVAKALQTYGAYIVDTSGGYGLSLVFEVPTNPIYPTSANPWTSIYNSIASGGDAYSGNGTGKNIQFGSCLQRIPASDYEFIQISSTLP